MVLGIFVVVGGTVGGTVIIGMQPPHGLFVVVEVVDCGKQGIGHGFAGGGG